MNAQQEAVALWQYLESRSLEPSARRVGTILRTMGLRCDDHDLRHWLRPFAKRPTAPKSSKTAVFHSFRLTITVPETTKKSDETEEAL